MDNKRDFVSKIFIFITNFLQFGCENLRKHCYIEQRDKIRECRPELLKSKYRKHLCANQYGLYRIGRAGCKEAK